MNSTDYGALGRFKVGLLLASILLLVGCGTPLESGTVVDRHYDPGHFVYDQCVMWDENGFCTMKGPRWIPDDYGIRIEGRNEDGETVRQWVDVTGSTYDSCEIGMIYERERGCRGG